MVRSTIRVFIPIDRQREALEILGSTSEQVRFEAGCVSSRVYRGMADEREIMIEELWENDDLMRRQLRSDQYRKVLVVVETSEDPPEIRFDTITDSSGFETIEKARNQS